MPPPPPQAQREASVVQRLQILQSKLQSPRKRSLKTTAPEIMDITKQGSGKANIKLQDSVLHGGTLPVIKLDNIHSTEGGVEMPPPDAPGPTIPTYAPDEETRATAKVLKTLQKQQPTASLPKGSGCWHPLMKRLF